MNDEIKYSYLIRQSVEIAVNNFAADWIDSDAFDNIFTSVFVSQSKSLNVGGEDGFYLMRKTSLNHDISLDNK